MRLINGSLIPLAGAFKSCLQQRPANCKIYTVNSYKLWTSVFLLIKITFSVLSIISLQGSQWQKRAAGEERGANRFDCYNSRPILEWLKCYKSYATYWKLSNDEICNLMSFWEQQIYMVMCNSLPSQNACTWALVFAKSLLDSPGKYSQHREMEMTCKAEMYISWHF